jgi:heme exporter protein C
MNTMNKKIWIAYWLVTAVLFAAVVTTIFAWTPTEATMGTVQKVFYLHLPVAINTFLACMVTFIASIGYLWQRRQVWDDLAVSSAKVAVLLCSVVLLTGMIWGHSAWGRWWTWSPRLTFSLVLWLLYVSYLVIRPSIESRQRRALVSAVYGVVAFLDVPLVYLSVKLMPDIHPSSISLAPEMKLTLMLSFVPVTMLAAGLIAARYRLQRAETLSIQQADDLLQETIPIRHAGGLT